MERRAFALGLASLPVSGMAAQGRSAKRTFARGTSPQVPRLSRTLTGETVNVRDYCAADGRRIDTQFYQELIDLRPATIVYPAGTKLTLDEAIVLRGDQYHRFAANCRMDSDVDTFALSATGLTSQNQGKPLRKIARYSKSFELDRNNEIKTGDMILLADVSDTSNIKIDANLVAKINGRTIFTSHEIGRSFDNIDGFRIYIVYDPIRNLSLSGALTCRNHHPQGGFLRATNAFGTLLDSLNIENTGHIGISIENSLNTRIARLSVEGSGASGLGIRASKEIYLYDFSAKNVRSDESLTFYDNVSVVKGSKIQIQQNLYSEQNSPVKSGNNILIDLYCSKIKLSNISCIGSATYNVMINHSCDDCSVSDFQLSKSNLGGIRISSRSNNTSIGPGEISDVFDLNDQEGKKPVSAISVGSSCVNTNISKNIAFRGISSNINIGRIDEKH